MDVRDTTRELKMELKRIDRAIAKLEQQLQDTNGSDSAGRKSSRGRKSMGSEERREVSERMKR